jgi:secreted trypsin-like serine protease
MVRTLARLALLLAVVALAVAGPASARTPAIVGGQVVQPGAFPWAASIQWVGPDGFFLDDEDSEVDVVPVCTGSLIGAQWVLTAGHCALAFGSVLGTPSSVATIGTPLSFQIVIGQTNIASPDPANVYLAGGEDVIALEPQAGGGLKGDLALIRLDRPAPQAAIRIPGVGQDSAALTSPGAPATVVGWGTTSEGAPDISYDLREVTVPLVSDADCAAAYPTLANFGYSFGFDPVTMFCAGLPEGGKDSCQGDSGGPLMASTASGWVQIGVTSWGEGCARSGLPGVYSRLSGLFGWIVSSLAKDPVAPAGPPASSAGETARAKRRSAIITGTVDPNGLATEYLIEIGKNRRYSTGRVEGYAGAGSTPVEISATFGDLKPGTTYYYRLTAFNAAGVVQSAELRLTTPPAKRTNR